MTTRRDIQAVLVYDDIEASQHYLVTTFGFRPGALHRAPDGTAVHGEVTTGSTAIWMHRVTHEQARLAEEPRLRQWPARRLRR